LTVQPLRATQDKLVSSREPHLSQAHNA
jgi:hypothetical protein